MSSVTAALQPTFTGHVATTNDALILFEACLAGQLSHVPRRPHDRERSMLIRSGCVFIYEENASGIKRWTDGVTWSPSRILGNFLVYRELDKPFPPGEKKRAMKKGNRPRPSRPGEPYARPSSHGGGYSPTTPSSTMVSADRTPDERERSLIGSLVDSYGFKTEGLVKKTMSVTVQGVTHHLVSYYSVGDVINGQLRTPSQTDSLNYVRPRPELTSKQSFRSPLEEGEDLEAMRDPTLTSQAGYGYRPSQVPHASYMTPSSSYYGSSVYSSASGHPSTVGGYPPGTSAIAGHYGSAQMHGSPVSQRGEDYASFPLPAFHPPYEPLSNNLTAHASRSLVDPSSGSPLPSNLRMRNQGHGLSLYPQARGSHGHILPTSATTPMEARHTTPYTRNTLTLPGNHIRPYSGVDGAGLMHTAPLAKAQPREAAHDGKVSAASGQYGYDRPQFYVNHGGSALSHAPYQPNTAMSSWTAQTQSQ